jgi:hypothetical protein
MGSTMGYAAGEYSAGIGGYCSLKNWDKSIGIIIPGRISENSESTSSHARIFLQILQLSFTHTHCFFLEGIFFLVLMVSTPLKNMNSSESVGIIIYIWKKCSKPPSSFKVPTCSNGPQYEWFTGRPTKGRSNLSYLQVKPKSSPTSRYGKSLVQTLKLCRVPKVN